MAVFGHGPGEPVAALDWWPRTCLVFTEYGSWTVRASHGGGEAWPGVLVAGSGGAEYDCGHPDGVDDPALRSITLMFALFNIGEGMLIVFLPHRARALGLGPGGYGYLVAALTCGELIAAGLLARRDWKRPLVPSILVSQVAAGGIVALLVPDNAAITVVAMAALGFVSAPMTAWAQTLRMREVQAAMHGRLFALLRTAMQATPPVGAALAAGVSRFGAPAVIGCVVAIMALPALGGAADLLRASPAVPQAGG